MAYVTEFASLSLACITDTKNLIIYWLKDGQILPNSYFLYADCQPYGETLDPSKYKHSCPYSRIFVLTILNVQREEHGVKWSCKGNNDRYSDETEIYVTGKNFF